MARNDAGLTEALYQITELRHEYSRGVKIPGRLDEYNPEVEKACRVADFIELGELMVRDAQQRRESCGGHFREEFQTGEGEACRDDENFSYVAAWEFRGNGAKPELHKEPLLYDNVRQSVRSYK